MCIAMWRFCLLMFFDDLDCSVGFSGATAKTEFDSQVRQIALGVSTGIPQ